MTVHKRCCYFMKPEEICKGHPVGVVWGVAILCGCGLVVAILCVYSLCVVWLQPVKSGEEGEKEGVGEGRPKRSHHTDEYNKHLHHGVRAGSAGGASHHVRWLTPLPPSPPLGHGPSDRVEDLSQ